MLFNWYFGGEISDNIKEKIIIVSPLNPGPNHSYESVVQAAVHEYVHTVVYQMNIKTPKDYRKIFGVTEDDIYNNWIEFISREYAE